MGRGEQESKGSRLLYGARRSPSPRRLSPEGEWQQLVELYGQDTLARLAELEIEDLRLPPDGPGPPSFLLSLSCSSQSSDEQERRARLRLLRETHHHRTSLVHALALEQVTSRGPAAEEAAARYDELEDVGFPLPRHPTYAWRQPDRSSSPRYATSPGGPTLPLPNWRDAEGVIHLKRAAMGDELLCGRKVAWPRPHQRHRWQSVSRAFTLGFAAVPPAATCQRCLERQARGELDPQTGTESERFSVLYDRLLAEGYHAIRDYLLHAESPSQAGINEAYWQVLATHLQERLPEDQTLSARQLRLLGIA